MVAEISQTDTVSKKPGQLKLKLSAWLHTPRGKWVIFLLWVNPHFENIMYFIWEYMWIFALS